MAGAFEVIFTLCGVDGEVALERTSDEVRYGLHWRWVDASAPTRRRAP